MYRCCASLHERVKPAPSPRAPRDLPPLTISITTRTLHECALECRVGSRHSLDRTKPYEASGYQKVSRDHQRSSCGPLTTKRLDGPQLCDQADMLHSHGF